MTFVRAYLLAVGAFSVVLGFGFMIWPVEMIAPVGFELATTEAVIDVQGFYGGQLIGIGAATLLGLWSPRFVIAGLLLAAAPLGGTAMGRIYGVLAAGECPALILALLVVELATAGVGGLLLQREIARRA